MKRRERLKILKETGCELVRHGGKHDWYLNPKTKRSQPVPRHHEINEILAKSIINTLTGDAGEQPQ